MFSQLFNKTYTIKKHFSAPLLEERLNYLKYWVDRGTPLNTIKAIAQNLLRIIEYLHLETANLITIEDVEKAADRWAHTQSNHPQKRITFSKESKERFIRSATHWLRRLGRLKLVPLFSAIFERPHAIYRHSTSPLLEERLVYLQYWSDNGAVTNTLRIIAQYLLIIMKYLNFYQLRLITLSEIEKAADRWVMVGESCKKGREYSKFAKARFIKDALGWFKMLDCLKHEAKEAIPFEEYLNRYIDYMREEQGLSENTVKSRFFLLQDFLINIKVKLQNFSEITPLTIDEVLVKKYDIDGYSRRTVQSYASVIRSFLRYAENQGLCQANLASSIMAPRVYQHESLPSSPSWDDVKKILHDTSGNTPTEIRDHAILMLLSVYGIRCSEIIHLCLEDIDWKKELLYLRRAKRSKPQIFPLSKIVGESILRYLQEVRPNHCVLREIFLCMRSPYRSLQSCAVYQIVNKKLRPLNLTIKHQGPHSLRHACATHLINSGISLKEISDHLGHQNLETSRIYAKVDLISLRKVAEFDVGGLL